MKLSYISDFLHATEDMEAKGQFLITDLSLIDYRNKSGKFLNCTISDRTGKMKAVLWNRAEDIYSAVKNGTVCDVTGKISRWKGSLKLNIDSIRPADNEDVQIEDYIAPPSRPVEEMLVEFRGIIDGINNPDIKKLCLRLLDDDEIGTAFTTSPAAKGWHHATASGLLEHTLSMARTAWAFASVREDINLDKLLAGVLFHDIGKVRELCVKDFHIDYTLEGRLVGHLGLGLIILDQLAEETGLSHELKAEIMHMIASHHGARDKGALQVPMTPEAFALHFIDDMDAQLEGIKAFKTGENGFTEYCKLLDRYLYFNDSKESDSDSEQGDDAVQGNLF